MFEPFRYPFVQDGLVEVLLLAPAAGVLGAWIVLRGLSFYSHGVATAAFPGLVLADGLGLARIARRLRRGGRIRARRRAAGTRTRHRRGQRHRARAHRCACARRDPGERRLSLGLVGRDAALREPARDQPGGPGRRGGDQRRRRPCRGRARTAVARGRLRAAGRASTRRSLANPRARLAGPGGSCRRSRPGGDRRAARGGALRRPGRDGAAGHASSLDAAARCDRARGRRGGGRPLALGPGQRATGSRRSPSSPVVSSRSWPPHG